MTTNMNNRFAELTIERDIYLGRDGMTHRQRNISMPAVATPQSINSRSHSQKNILMEGAGAARTYVLPRATGSGRKYRFYVGTVNTSGYVIRSSNGADVMTGSVLLAGATATTFTGSGTVDTYTMNGTTTGGVARGDWVEFTDLKANLWAVCGLSTYSGAAATPFSDTVA